MENGEGRMNKLEQVVDLSKRSRCGLLKAFEIVDSFEIRYIKKHADDVYDDSHFKEGLGGYDRGMRGYLDRKDVVWERYVRRYYEVRERK